MQPDGKFLVKLVLWAVLTTALVSAAIMLLPEFPLKGLILGGGLGGAVGIFVESVFEK